MCNDDIAWALRMGRRCCMQWACNQIVVVEMDTAVGFQGAEVSSWNLPGCSIAAVALGMCLSLMGFARSCLEFHSDASWWSG